MNNKGFTLIELLVSIAIISIMTISSIVIVNNTLAVTDEKAYDILKKSIVTQVGEYIFECDNNLIECNNDYVWSKVETESRTSFSFDVLRKYSYFTKEDYINPITDEDIGKCLIINVVKDENFSTLVTLDDSNCLK